MIAKHIPMQSLRKSNYAELVNYLTDTQQKIERVGRITLTNCASNDAESAALEVLATQARNRRAHSDKTYHLVVSFAPGETPDAVTLQAIETRLCDALGFGEHQRVSVVHDDTDNLHVHIAINKIHPHRLTSHSPYDDYKVLGYMCAKLEQEYGLRPCNHMPRLNAAENRANDMEQHAGFESLLGWIKRECRDQLLGADSWEALHALLHDNGLRLHERGNGLIVTAADGTHVKASSIDRQLSKPSLVKRMGQFRPSSIDAACSQGPKKVYTKKPIAGAAETVELYARYQAEQANLHAKTSEAWAQARARRHEAIEAAKRRGRLKRAAIKLFCGSAAERKFAYAATSWTLRNDIERAHRQYRKECPAKAARKTWTDWLRHEASQGNAEALAALRRRKPNVDIGGQTLSGTAKPAESLDTAAMDGVTKRGTVIYAVGETVVREIGDRMQVSRGAKQSGVGAALRLAVARYGTCVHVEGSESFKDTVVRAAIAEGLGIRFDTSELERRRKSILQDLHEQEQHSSQAPVQATPLTPVPLVKPLEPVQQLHMRPTPQAIAAAEQYVFEREQKRLKGFDIPKHTRYDGFIGHAQYAGLRDVMGQKLALIRLDGAILVQPVNEADASRLKALKVGQDITLAAGGSIRTKGQKR